MPQISINEGIFPHLLYTPDNLVSRDDWPLIIFLHGSGERGTDLDLVRKWSLPKFLDAGNNLPAIVISPQCPENVRWTETIAKVLALVDEAIEAHPINPQKIYLTGFSMGGQGTWAVAFASPDRFAAVAPVAGRTPEQADFLARVCILKDKPLWVIHGVKDEAVDVAYSENVIKALRDCGASNLTYTRYDDAGHGETSDRIYSNPELYDWFLQYDTGN